MSESTSAEPATPGTTTRTTAISSIVPVDISTIEAAKENIIPLHSGRSATQLASVFSSSSTRSGLGVKLEAEHVKFRAQISAVEEYEKTGKFSASGEDESLKLNEGLVVQLAEDPLDISHQYVRFIIANYPAGANAANKLVPVLEETTRRFLGDERYTNDPRYFRLWAHYAKNMESPEECYRFLFAKGIAEKLAALYEEYAKVLEAAGK
jgi:checkpoint serine/threonine-protein kinase